LALKYAQEQNDLKGYGNDRKNWSEIKYENQRRKLKLQERIKKVKKCLRLVISSKQS